MALAERAELVARLSLKDDFTGSANRIKGSMAGLGKAAGRAGKAISVGIGAGLAVGAAVTLRAVRSGIDSLAELEDATTSVDGAIKQMGQTGKVTSAQIAGWANEIEAATQAAFDDKEITQAATTLIRYGKVAPKSLKQTLTVMTDLAAKTGSVDSAASKLAKSLADPTKATRVLREVGVTLTEAQQKQIKVWVANGKLGKAQALILKEVAEVTKGAAKAMNGPYRDSQKVFADVMEDSTRALATGFLPVLEEIRAVLSEELAKPATLARIKEFGEGMAGGLRGLVSAVRGVDWDAVGNSLKIAGQGAKAVYDAFMGMPDWVKAAVLTGWGLNKVTGGAVGDLVGSGIEVGLKGVFGQFFARGSSFANPMYVTGAIGGAGGPGGVVTSGGGVLGLISKVFIVGFAAEAARQIAPLTTQAGIDLGKLLFPNGPPLVLPKPADLPWPFGTKGQPDWAGGDPNKPNTPLPRDPRNLSEGNKAIVDALANAQDKHESSIIRRMTGTTMKWTPTGVVQIEDRRGEGRAIRQQAALAASKDKMEAMRIALQSAKVAQVSAIRTGDAAIVSAIKAQGKPVINLKVNVSNTSRVRVYQTGGTVNRTGSGSGPGGPVSEDRL